MALMWVELIWKELHWESKKDELKRLATDLVGKSASAKHLDPLTAAHLAWPLPKGSSTAVNLAGLTVVM